MVNLQHAMIETTYHDKPNIDYNASINHMRGTHSSVEMLKCTWLLI